jgi:hypothetical protein
MRKIANPTSHRNFAPQHSKKMVAPRICNTFAMGNITAQRALLTFHLEKNIFKNRSFWFSLDCEFCTCWHWVRRRAVAVQYSSTILIQAKYARSPIGDFGPELSCLTVQIDWSNSSASSIWAGEISTYLYSFKSSYRPARTPSNCIAGRRGVKNNSRAQQ